VHAKSRMAIVVVLLGIFPSACNDPIPQSHIDANVPGADQFDQLLKQDLQAYFQKSHPGSVTVAYDLLRDGPTQTGIAYPKYYVWVKVHEAAGLVDEGAVRVAAIDKTRFEVTHFMSKREIQGKPGGVERVFPTALADNIRMRAGVGP
jgi:hypothetical protein